MCFVAVGDSVCDDYPLQVGQFEANDAALDTWLTRTYIEGGGGGNNGESYSLVWSFAATKVVADAFKKGRKGILITMGDEPCLEETSKSEFNEVYGAGNHEYQGEQSAKSLLKAAQNNWEVFHINIIHGMRNGSYNWKELLGQRVIEINNFTLVPQTVVSIVSQAIGGVKKPPQITDAPIPVPSEMEIL